MATSKASRGMMADGEYRGRETNNAVRAKPMLCNPAAKGNFVTV
jgi:hypothetical protein